MRKNKPAQSKKSVPELPDTAIANITVAGITAHLFATGPTDTREVKVRLRFVDAAGKHLIIEVGMVQIMALSQLCKTILNSSAATIVKFGQ